MYNGLLGSELLELDYFLFADTPSGTRKER